MPAAQKRAGKESGRAAGRSKKGLPAPPLCWGGGGVSPFASPGQARWRASDGIAPRSPDRETVASRMKRQQKADPKRALGRNQVSRSGGQAHGSFAPPMHPD